MQNNKREVILISKKDEAIDVVSLYFKTVDGEKFDFISGQYVDIKPPSINGHGKSYTISSTPDDELIRITIKRKGAVSSAIIDLNIGDSITFEGPYGNFYPEDNMHDVVFLAGGIGVTPFISFINSNISAKSDTNITLLYSNKTVQDVTFLNDLSELSKKNENLKVVHFITQEKIDDLWISEFERIDKDNINKYAAPLSDRNYYICGSISFVADTWRMLKSVGVDEESIYTESFY